ncbi:MAG: cytochrome P450 [Steroidobacteraceae bacterium]
MIPGPDTLQALAGWEGPSSHDVEPWRCPRTQVWVVESDALVREVLSHPEHYSSKVSLSALDPGFPAAEVEAIHRAEGVRFTRTLQTNDSPDHRRFRSLVDKVFTPSRAEAIAPEIRGLCRELLSAWPGGSVFDAVAGYAMPLPLELIAQQLGVPREDHALLRSWSDAAITAIGLGATREQHLDAARQAAAFQRYFRGVLGDPLRRPEGSLIALIAAAAGEEGSRLDEAEQLSLLHTLMIAGHETTASTLASAMLALATCEGLMDRLRGEGAPVKRFVEDVLRIHAPVQGLFRRVREPARLGGADLAVGDLLCLRLGAANRDPARHASSELSSVPMGGLNHLSFGLGLHHCIGAALARKELVLAVEALLGRFQSLRLAVPLESLGYTRSVMTRGLIALPLIGVEHAA